MSPSRKEDGVFFDRQERISLIETVRKFGEMSFDPSEIRAHALMFDKEVFKRKMGDFIGHKPQLKPCPKNRSLSLIPL